MSNFFNLDVKDQHYEIICSLMHAVLYTFIIPYEITKKLSAKHRGRYAGEFSVQCNYND
jgi:hypothetical protein